MDEISIRIQSNCVISDQFLINEIEVGVICEMKILINCTHLYSQIANLIKKLQMN